MTPDPGIELRVLARRDIAAMRGMLAMFGTAFDDPATYTGRPPGDDDLARWLDGADRIAIAALSGDRVVGGLAAYVLHKFEQVRAEVYLYDLAVEAAWRRRGIATALIRRLQHEARSRGAWVVFVQADHGDDAAVALYTKLGRREDVMHFDLDDDPAGPAGDAAARGGSA